jgi:hypothetical protein
VEFLVLVIAVARSRISLSVVASSLVTFPGLPQGHGDQGCFKVTVDLYLLLALLTVLLILGALASLLMC